MDAVGGRLSTLLLEAMAREAYAIECGRHGIAPDWTTVPEETKNAWREYVSVDWSKAVAGT